jgi:hypothetical protein
LNGFVTGLAQGCAERPHIGEYAGKTNAFAGCKSCNPRVSMGAGWRVSAGLFARKSRLLAVVLQHLVAGRRDLRAVLLQAGENREITLIDDRATVALDVTVAGGLFLRRATARRLRRLLRESGCGGGQESDSQSKLAHEILHSTAVIHTLPNEASANGADSGVEIAAYRSDTTSTSMSNAAKLTAAVHSL